MSYFRRPNPKSNWKRPKPKIYDCNARDLENFYQKSYSEYISAKNDRQARDLDRDRRGDAEELTKRFEQRRASSLVYGEDDSPRAHRLIPNRQTSNDGTNEHSFLRSRLESSLEGGSADSYKAGESRSSTSATRHVTFNSTLNAPDSNSEMASIETRLERLRKLREDLGLPAEVNGSSSSYGNSSSLTSSTETESRGRESSRWTKSGSVTRSDSRARGSPSRGIQESTSSSSYSRTERNSNLRNGTDDTSSGYKPRSSRNVSNQEEQSTYTSRSSKNASSLGDQASSYSSKSSYSAGGDSNGYKDSYESTSSSRRARRVEKPSLDGIDMDFDDDALLTDVKKKFPSSSEILERIKKMDID